VDSDDLLHEALSRHSAGDVAGARKLYAQILATDPGHFNARLNLASMALDAGKLDEAATLLDTLLDENDSSGVAHLLRARASFLRVEHELGYANIQRAHELMPEDDAVTGEYVAAMRRRAFTFNAEEYKILRDVAQKGQLKDSRWQRLAQLTLARMVTPELIKLLTQEGGNELPDAVTRWQHELPIERKSALSVMARDLEEYVNAMKQQERWQPQRCNLQLRRAEGTPEQEPVACEEFSDVDSLTGATLEIVKLHDVEFIPFADIRTIEFGELGVAVPALVTLAGGRTTSGLVPLFYLFTDFAQSEKVRTGRTTLYRAIVPGIVAGVGLRSFNSTRGLIPLANIERIDFK
jgi:hypothetical protein